MTDSKTGSTTDAPSGASCACAGLGPLVTEFFRRLGPGEEARRHFQQARVEVLKGIRAALDKRIEDLSREPASKGTHVNVE